MTVSPALKKTYSFILFKVLPLLGEEVTSFLCSKGRIHTLEHFRDVIYVILLH